MSERYDVQAVSIATGAVRYFARNVSDEDAQAVIKMAVWRRGVDEEYYRAVPAAPESPTPAQRSTPSGRHE